MKKQALVVGGTGMLADTCVWLAEQGYHVTVIGRSERRLQQLAARVPITAISVDYTNSDALSDAVNQAMDERGPFDLVVAWIHSTAPSALHTIEQANSARRETPWNLYHVRGSNAFLETDFPAVSANCLYHRIILGFVLAGDRSRWHTNDEIASGVIRAIEADQADFIVGICQPWEKRP